MMRPHTPVALAAFVLAASALVGCSDDAPPDPEDVQQEDAMPTPDGATDLRATLGQGVSSTDELRAGVTRVEAGRAGLQLDTRYESLSANVELGDRFQLGDLDLEIVSLEEDTGVTVRIHADRLAPSDPLPLPLPGRRTFADEAGVGTRTGDPSELEFMVRRDGQWEFLDLATEVQEVEFEGYRLEVLEVDGDEASVRVTAPDGTVLPRFDDDGGA